MGEAKGFGMISEVENLSKETNSYPRDLLQRLNQKQTERNFGEDSEDIELNLGLSLGGRFGVEPKGSNSNNKLYRSTSIATFMREENPQPAASVYPLMRTSSLPMESEEEWRKRKEMQTLRRMEAKRKRSEKQKNTRLARERTCSLERNCEVDLNFKGKVDGTPAPPVKQQVIQQHVNGFPPAVSMPFGMPHWAASFRGSAPQNKFDVLTGTTGTGQGQGQGTVQHPPSQGSMGSSSSGISEFESRSVQGIGNCNGGSSSPSSIQSIPNQIEQKPVISSTSTDTKTSMSVKLEVESPKKKPRLPDNAMRETGMKVMEEMPCVSTTGDGLNGRKIEGFLYKYKKGEEVRIVCVCHGSFLTPAEFVKHAGGGDVTHPLRHIKVSSNPSFL